MDGKTLNAVPVDHFISWSFVKDDKIRNFILAGPVCNSPKSHIIPASEYFDENKERNSILCTADELIIQPEFKTYTYFKFTEMWYSAIYNGFHDNWKLF